MSIEPPLTVGLISLGCAKNLVDTQIMSGVLLTEGLTLAHDANHADIVLINTCAFIEAAREEASAIIDEMSAHKAGGGCRAVIVTGCLPQRYRGALAARFPQVDAWLGVDELESIAHVAREAAARPPDAPPVVLVSSQPKALFAPRIPQLAFSHPASAYLKIAEGCNHACAFCAIPGIRGRFRSRPVDALVAEARALLKDGRRELNLVAQDSTGYGRDRRGAPRLAGLLRALDALPGRFWIRILYGYPAAVGDDLLAAMAGARHVLPYLDIPIQHSHPDILRAMRRADTVRVLPGLVPRLRAALPGVVLRTTCLVGFPGETEAHFEHLAAFVAQTRFDHLGVFAFSPEAGTPARELPDPVPAEVAAARRDRLMRVQQGVVEQNNRARIGTTTEALLLHPDPTRRGGWLARADWQAPDVDGETRLEGLPASAKTGDLVKIRIVGAEGYDFTGVPARRPAAPSGRQGA